MNQLRSFHRGLGWVFSGKSRLNMKRFASLAVLALATLAVGAARARAAEDEGVALAIIYDTSGSMRDPVPDSHGKSSSKYLIANRALIAIARQLQAFATNTATGAPRKLQAGLFVFNGESAREAISFGPFDSNAFENWARSFSNPSGNTPLGNALSMASRRVLQAPLSRKHVLVITDGLNTAGPKPEDVLPLLKRQAEQQHAGLSVHFVAFDVAASQFAPLKKLGATVVGAADEKQLNAQLDFILQKKILLEDEEPKK
jgi:hypothetical protein